MPFCRKAESLGYEFDCEDFIFVVGSAANPLGKTFEFTAFGNGPDAKPRRASAFWFFLSTTMVFAAARTHFPRKNNLVYRNTVTFRNGSEVKHSRASAFRYFLQEKHQNTTRRDEVQE